MNGIEFIVAQMEHVTYNWSLPVRDKIYKVIDDIKAGKTAREIIKTHRISPKTLVNIRRKYVQEDLR